MIKENISLIDQEKDISLAVLWEFLNYPLNSSYEILEQFAKLPRAIYNIGTSDKQAFVYIQGTRTDAATLIAHADTVYNFAGEHKMKIINGVIYSTQVGVGIGADDRAGCAILWLLRNYGHNILVIGGEEYGQPTANWIVKEHTKILNEIQKSSFMLEFDRRTFKKYKFYNLPNSNNFKIFLEAKTGYSFDSTPGYTDICILATKGCCAANLSVGFYNAHSLTEYLVINEWLYSLEVTKKLLSEPLKRFILRNNTKK